MDKVDKQKLSLVFDSRNIQDILTVGVNFTPQTLNKSLDASVADSLADSIGSEYVVLAASGIGSFAISLINNKRIKHVWLYSENPSNTKMLSKNLSMFVDEDNQYKYTIMGKRFTDWPIDEELNSDNEYAYFFDFSWSDNLTIGDKTFAEWVESGIPNNITTIQSRYPYGKDFPINIPNLLCNNIDIKANGSIQICIRGKQEAKQEVGIKAIKEKFNRMFVRCGIPENLVESILEQEEWNWFNKDETIDLNKNMRYSSLLGKNIYKHAVTVYIHEKHGGKYDPQMIDQIEYLTSTEFLSMFYSTISPDRYVVSKLSPTLELKIKTFFSIIGTLSITADKVKGKPFGTAASFNVITYILNIKIQDSMMKRMSYLESKTSKQEVEDFMHKVYANTPTYSRIQNNGSIEVSIFNNDPDGNLSSFQIFNNQNIGTSTTSYAPISKYKAYRSSLETIRSFVDVNVETNVIITKSVHSELYSKAMQKASEEEYSSIYLDGPITDGYRYFSRLLGYSEGKVIQLSEGIGYDRIKAEREALNNYVN